jgi:hypothetical protein
MPKVNVKVSELYYIEHQGYMKGNGKMIIEMDVVWKDTVMVISTKAISKIINHMVKESTHGWMVKFMKGNGKVV